MSVTSKDPAAVYGLKSGSRKQKRGEDGKAFIARVVKTGPKVIAKCDGDLPVVAMVFGVQLPMMEDIMAANRKTLGPALTKARAVAAAKVHQTAEVAAEAKKALMAEVSVKDKRMMRKSWPVDEAQRRDDIWDALCVSLVENEGDVAETSMCLSVPINEINEMLEGDEVLLSARDVGLQVKATRAESQAFKQMEQGNTQMIKMVLNNLMADRWSDKQQVDIRRVGFAPPAEKEAEEVSVLQLIKGEKEDA